jgi:PST family polysaccharide transporter
VVTDSFGQAAYPAFSKIQDDKESLKEFIVKSINMLSLVIVPVALFMAALGPELIQTIYGPKWLPGLNSFYLYMTVPLGIPIALPLYIAIVSLGKASLILYINTTLVALQWGLGSVLVWKYGFIGVPMAQPIIFVIFSAIYLAVLRKNSVNVNLIDLRFFHIVVGIFCSLILLLTKTHCPVTIFSVGLLFTAAFSLYGALVYLFRRRQFTEVCELVTMKLLGVPG